MRNLQAIFIALLFYASCQPQPDSHHNNSNKAIGRYTNEVFILLDSSASRIDTICVFGPYVVDAVINMDMHKDKCILIYRNADLIAFSSFEKTGGRWNVAVSQLLLFIRNNTGQHDFKIMDENHVRVKEVATKKVKTYELNYTEKRVSVTETIDQ